MPTTHIRADRAVVRNIRQHLPTQVTLNANGAKRVGRRVRPLGGRQVSSIVHSGGLRRGSIHSRPRRRGRPRRNQTGRREVGGQFSDLGLSERAHRGTLMHLDTGTDAACGIVRDTVEIFQRNLWSIQWYIRAQACGPASTRPAGTWWTGALHHGRAAKTMGGHVSFTRVQGLWYSTSRSYMGEDAEGM